MGSDRRRAVVELDALEDQQQAAFLTEADKAGFAIDELYGSLGVNPRSQLC